MADIAGKKIRYTIKAIVEYDAGEHNDVEYLLDEIRQYGEAEIEKMETID